MQFFLDTANLDLIRHWQAFGLVDGVTTNPALLAKEGGDPLRQLENVCELVPGPVSAQVTAANASGMIAQGRALAKIRDNVVVKIPATAAGYNAAEVLVGEGVSCNITLCFQPAQAIPFARLGATYVSLIVGRTEDFGLSSREETARTRGLIDAVGSRTKLLVASLRNPTHLTDAVLGGADVVTVPPTTWDLIHQNPLSIQGQGDFARAWASLSNEARENYECLSAA